ncbi:MAG: ASKHA domain-containing protein [Syntrophomonas sp.]
MAEQVEVRLIAPDGRQITKWTIPGKNLWEVIAGSGMDPEGSCGGKGTCGKCKVRIDGRVNEISEEEREQLLAEELKAGIRVACKCTVNDPLKVYLDYASAHSDSKNRITRSVSASNDPAQVRYQKILIPGLDKEDPVPIHTRLRNALPAYRLDLNTANLNQLALLDRVGRPSLELNALILDEAEVKYLGREREKACGLALDLGSTSLFAALLDLETCEILAVATRNNMQRVYGADIVSRISYCLENEDGLEKMQRILVNNLNDMIEEITRDSGTSANYIYRLTAVGNPVMLHFLMGLNTSGFAFAPYAGLFVNELSYRAEQLGLNVNPGAELLLLPQVSGFVGADTIACLLTLPQRRSERFLLIDVGTNGEIVVSDRGKMWAASAAAGPAFEGGNIKSGMRAGNGAIDKAYLSEENRIEVNVLGEGPAKGICGSAVIDIVACLLKASYIDRKGTIDPVASDCLNVRQGERGAEILLAENHSLSSQPVVFNQEDIRQVQLAKGAIRTAIDILMKEASLEYKDLDKVYLAGSFGNYLDPENTILIGMIPPVKREIVKNIGNAAGEGAVAALLSKTKRQEARQLNEQIRYVELARHAGFQKTFLNNLDFPELKKSEA